MEKDNSSKEFDPSQTSEFQENLSKAFEDEDAVTEPINIITEDSPNILSITDQDAEEETVSEQAPEQAPDTKNQKDSKDGQETDDIASVNEASEENAAADGIEDDAEEDAAADDIENMAENNSEEEPEELPVIDTSFAFEEEMQEEAEVDDTVLENISSQLASQVTLEYGNGKDAAEKKRPVWLIPVISAAACLILLLIFFFGTTAGRRILIKTDFGKHLIASVGGSIFEDETTYDPGEATPSPDGMLTPEPEMSITPEPELTPEPSITPDVSEPAEAECYHILILGMDEGEIAAPMSDLMILLTLDVNSQKIKLTTILRDLFVQIPDNDADKIGNVYSKGGISLVYDTLESNFGVRPDGYLLFDYEGFRQVVDAFGGVTMTVTAREAEYLNRTNYISLSENRTLTAGMNHLNGDQALGYCRIRHIATAQNEYNDIGRAARCRRVISALFEQSKDQSAGELYLAVKQCLAQLTTDITGDECTAYLELVLGMDTIELSEYRLPVDGTYETSIIRGSSTLVANLIQNQKLWQEFLAPEIPVVEEPTPTPVQ